MAVSALKPLLKRLKELRDFRGWTQERAAEACGISYKYFQHIEGGRRPNLRLETLERLAAGYGIELWQLFAPEVPKTVENKRNSRKAGKVR